MSCIIGDFKYIVKTAENISKQELKSRDIPVRSQHIIIFHLIGDKQVLFNNLQAELQFSKSTLSDAINKYEGLGLIKKTECLADKRNIYVSLTEQGLKVWDELAEIDQLIKAKMFKQFDDESQFNIEINVHKMMENMK